METLHLEGFSDSLRGAKVYCVASSTAAARDFLKSQMNRLSEDVSNRGRKVLVCPGTVPRWLQNLGWDASFRLQDNQDIKLALTYIQHMTKPGRVVWIGDPAPTVLAHLNKIDGLSLICVGAQPSADWQAVFWMPGASVEDVEPILIARMGPQGRLKAILSELRAADVGLVWSSIREDKRGALYWYDPATAAAAPIDPEETAEMLRNLADTLFRAK